MSTSSPRSRSAIWKTLLTSLIFLTVIVLLMTWLMGNWHRKIKPVIAHEPQRYNGPTQVIEELTLPRVESAVGTVQAVRETAVASRLLARVLEMPITAGQQVQEGELLVRLDDLDLQARRAQALAAVQAASAARDLAQIDFNRVQQLFNAGQAPQMEMDNSTSRLRATTAELERAEQLLREAQTILDYSVIRSPMDGVIIDTLVEVGDTVTPGQVVMRLYDATRMQLVANVRESLAQRLRVGDPINVTLEAFNKQCQGQIVEIVPQAQAASRTFLVKVAGPCPPGVYPGMFGRLLIPLDVQKLTVVPEAAVQQVGQLKLVTVISDGRAQLRILQLGNLLHDQRVYEVLSGLQAGEQIALPQHPDDQES
ncbi:MAG: Multidrug resistance protein MdtA [Phycisphaerae bacterium]|nr:Multidrug resistance protein MdtA [Phycisphaerae bacterium]